MKDETLKLIECPRDAWQGLPKQIPTELKVRYLRALIDAGFRHLDAVSFVSPKAVPQMADSETVLARLAPPDEVEIIGIVVNEKGAERAIATGAVTTLGFPCSISETFLRRNQNQSPEENLATLTRIHEQAEVSDLEMVVYISMAFGNPYQDLWRIERLVEAVRGIAALEVDSISLADTVGVADADLIRKVVTAVVDGADGQEIGVASAQDPGRSCGESPGRIRRRLPAFRRGIWRSWRLSVCAGRDGRKYPDRRSCSSARGARSAFADRRQSRKSYSTERRDQPGFFSLTSGGSEAVWPDSARRNAPRQGHLSLHHTHMKACRWHRPGDVA